VLLKGRTSITIAHRLSTVRHADSILVIKDGRLAEQGSHGQLMQAGGLYRDLIELQFKD
jgi:ABC-type multidrug transport system fused ATPase/permease subunit